MTPRRRFSGQRAGRRRASIGSVLIAALLLGGVLSILALGRLDEGRLAPACPPGLGRGVWDPAFFFGDDAPTRNAAQKLLDNPNFGASPEAAGDLEAGIVDERLVAALRDVTRGHSICVDAFKEGHYFLPGVPEGPRIPEGYGEAGGLPNTHYFGRAADIRWVDGKPVEGNSTDPEVLDVGRILADIPKRRRPDQIIGPAGWTRALGYGREAGWVLDPDQLELHEDHLHIGYTARAGTSRRGKA
ncbi:MAG: hypothetical protein M3N09_05920 [Actinomycetota bacterium]|nr:hypothetical protein [Actinomycetota bacterium]